MNSDVKKNKINTVSLLIRFSVILILFIIIALILNYFKIISIQDIFYNTYLTSKPSKNGQNLNGDSGKIIAKAGAENIYQIDLDTEIKYYPLTITDAIRKNLLDKIIKDSIILQSVKSTGYVKLDQSVYNSAQKDYIKRVKLVEDAKKMLENRQSAISGNIVAVWFLNGYPGKAGLEKGREIAFNKAKSLQARVKNKSITIQQAAQEIIDDKKLADVDPSYADNAIFGFRSTDDEDITHDEDFNVIIKSLKVGEVSDVYPVKDLASGSDKQQETSYMFAEITERKVSGNKINFEKWYDQERAKYEITYY